MVRPSGLRAGYQLSACIRQREDSHRPARQAHDAYMQVIDATVDDGELATGSFRRVGGTCYFFTVAN